MVLIITSLHIYAENGPNDIITLEPFELLSLATCIWKNQMSIYTLKTKKINQDSFASENLWIGHWIHESFFSCS